MKTRDVVQTPNYESVLTLVRLKRPYATAVLNWLDSSLEDGLRAFESREVQNAIMSLNGFGHKTLNILRHHLRMVSGDMDAPPEVVAQDACQTCKFWNECFVVNETNVPEAAGTGICRRFNRCTSASSICSGFSK